MTSRDRVKAVPPGYLWLGKGAKVFNADRKSCREDKIRAPGRAEDCREHAVPIRQVLQTSEGRGPEGESDVVVAAW